MTELKPKIIVTGPTGHIGNSFVRLLCENGYDVAVIILKGEKVTPLAGLKVKKFEGNVLDIKSLGRAFEKTFQGAETKIVCHLAGIIDTMPGKNKDMWKVNVDGTGNIIELCRKYDAKLIYVSSIHALGNIPHGKIIDESFPFNPDIAMGDYGKSKAVASLKVLNSGLDTVIICPTGAIGPYDFKPSQMGQFFLNFASKKVIIYIDGAFNFVDTQDLSKGILLALQEALREEVWGETYILSGELISINELMDILQEVTGKNPRRLKIPIWLAKTAAVLNSVYYKLTKTKPLITRYSIDTLRSNSRVSCEKARRKLGYNPRSTEEAVRDAIEWFIKNGKLEISWPFKEEIIELLSVTP